MRLKVNNTYCLGGCVLILALLCLISIGSPMYFEKQKARRESAVKERLMTIRAAEEKYRARHGVYAASFKELARCGLLADSLADVPGVKGQRFSLTATTLPGKSGNAIPVMECGATYKQYLDGLDKASVDELTQEANANGRFPGLKIGDTETPNDNVGNW